MQSPTLNKAAHVLGSPLMSNSYTVNWGQQVRFGLCAVLSFVAFMNEVKMVCKAHVDKVLMCKLFFWLTFLACYTFPSTVNSFRLYIINLTMHLLIENNKHDIIVSCDG